MSEILDETMVDSTESLAPIEQEKEYLVCEE